jgi:hypothetical protein
MPLSMNRFTSRRATLLIHPTNEWWWMSILTA